MSSVEQIIETCVCGASIKIVSDYPSSHLRAFHEQHKECFVKPVKHVLTLPVGNEP